MSCPSDDDALRLQSPGELVRVGRIGDSLERRVLALEKRVEELEIAREQETPPAAVSGAPTVDGQHDGAAASGETAAPDLQTLDAARHEAARLRWRNADLSRERDKLRKLTQRVAEALGTPTDGPPDGIVHAASAMRRCCDDHAAQYRDALVAERDKLREALQLSERERAQFRQERDEARGVLHALQDDHELLKADYAASCEARAKLTALEDALRAMVERAAAEIVDRKARENLLQDLKAVLGE